MDKWIMVREYSKTEKPGWVADLRQYRLFSSLIPFAYVLSNGGQWLLEPSFFNRLAFDDNNVYITKGDQ